MRTVITGGRPSALCLWWQRNPMGMVKLQPFTESKPFNLLR